MLPESLTWLVGRAACTHSIPTWYAAYLKLRVARLFAERRSFSLTIAIAALRVTFVTAMAQRRRHGIYIVSSRSKVGRVYLIACHVLHDDCGALTELSITTNSRQIPCNRTRRVLCCDMAQLIRSYVRRATPLLGIPSLISQ